MRYLHEFTRKKKISENFYPHRYPQKHRIVLQHFRRLICAEKAGNQNSPEPLSGCSAPSLAGIRHFLSEDI
jgi:hypothetical protein